MSETLPRLIYAGKPVRPVQAGYTTRDPYGAVVTNIPGGLSRVATDHLAGVYEVSATYQLSSVEYLWWGAFYHTTLKEGSMPFIAELALDTPIIQEYVCQIVAQPSKPRNLGFYTEVTLTLEAEPIIDDAYNDAVVDIIGGGYGDETVAMLNLLDLYANTWCPEYLRPDLGIHLDFILRRYTRNGTVSPLEEVMGFSRASQGTDYVGGVLTEFPVNSARVGDGGLLVERDATNWLLNTGNAAFSRSSNTTITRSSEWYQAVRIAAGAGSVYLYLTHTSVNGEVPVSPYVCCSCFVRLSSAYSNGVLTMNARFDGSTAYQTVQFDIGNNLTPGVSTSGVISSGSKQVGPLTYLVFITLECTVSSTSNRSFYISTPPVDIPGSVGYEISYPQVTDGLAPSSLIINGGSQVTRQHDIASVDIGGYGARYGSLALWYYWDGRNYRRTIFSFKGGTGSDSVSCRHLPTGGIELTVLSGGVTLGTMTYPTPAEGVVGIAISYSPSLVSMAINGAVASFAPTGDMPVFTQITLGSNTGGTEQLDSHIRKAWYKPDAYTEQQLIEITQ